MSPISSASTRTSPPTTTRSKPCASCWRCPASRAASSASTSRRFRAARPSPRWSCAKTGGCGRGVSEVQNSRLAARGSRFAQSGCRAADGGLGGGAAIGSACGRGERRVFEPRSRSARGWGPTRIEQRLRLHARSRLRRYRRAARGRRAVSRSDPRSTAARGSCRRRTPRSRSSDSAG